MAANGIYLCSRELEALTGLPDVQFRLYVTARQFMDYSTGIVGLKRGISWQSLREELYIEPSPGIKGGSPSKDQIRRAMDGLQRVGLIRYGKNNEQNMQLIFKCILAEQDKSAQKQPATNPPRLPATLEAAPVLDSSHKAATVKTTKAATPPSVRDNTIPPPPPILSSSSRVGVVVEFSKNIKPEYRQTIEGYLGAVQPEDQQPILDDLIGFISTQSGKGLPVTNQAGVLRRMIDRYKQGEWAPEQSHIGKAIRQREKQAPKPQETSKALSGVNQRSRPPGSMKEALALLGVK